MNIIPLAAVPAQQLTATLGGVACQISIYTLGYDNRLYFDLSILGAPTITCVLCQDRVKLVQLAYLGLTGDLSFIDLQGVSDPVYTGLGSRYVLAYLT